MHPSTPPPEASLEHFRQLIRAELSAKGVLPPAPNSAREEELYQQWLRGRQHLHNTSDVD